MATSIKITTIPKTLANKLDIEIQDFQKYDLKTAKKMLHQMNTVAKKRVKTINKNNRYSHALEKNKTTLENFSVKGKNINDLTLDFRNLRDFLNSETSTIKGIKQLDKKISERLGGEFTSNEQGAKFWKVYDRLKETDSALIQQLGSERVQQEIFQLQNDDIEDMYSHVMDRIDDLYEEFYS